MHISFKFACIIGLLSLSSCTSFLLPDTQSVVFITDSDSSQVLADNKELGKGKNISTNIERAGLQEIVIQTPGFKDEHHLLIPERRDPWFYPVAILDLPLVLVNWEQIVRHPNSLLYANEIHLVHQVFFEKRKAEQRYVNIHDVKIDIKNFEEDIQFYVVPHEKDIEPKLIEQKQLRISENLEAKRLEEERLAQLSNKKRKRLTIAPSLEKADERKSLFAENRFLQKICLKCFYNQDSLTL